MAKKIRCDSMAPGFTYGVSFYDSKNVIQRAKLISRPAVAVKNMSDNDKYVMEIDGKIVEFFRNACPPHYLETKRRGVSGRIRNVRMTFFDIGLEVIPESKPANIVLFQRQRGNVNKAVTPGIIYLGSPKPNRADYDTRGKYNHAYKMWKKSQARIAENAMVAHA